MILFYFGYLYTMPRKPDGDQKKVIKSYQVDPTLFKDFEEVCHRLHIKSLSSQVEALIREWVERDKKKKKIV